MTRLSNEEVDEIAAKYLELRNNAKDSEQDYKTFKRYQNVVLEKLRFLVERRTAKYKQFSNFPDLKQDGFEALLMAFRTFNPDKGVFGWWADQYIKTRVARAANAHSTIRIPIKKTKFMKPYKVSEIPVIIDEGLLSFDSLEYNMHGKKVRKAVDFLPDNHRSVINMTYGLNGLRERPITHVMKSLSISRQQYNRLLIDAQSKIKKFLLES